MALRASGPAQSGQSKSAAMREDSEQVAQFRFHCRGSGITQRSSPELRITRLHARIHPRSSGELRYFPGTRRHLGTRLCKS